VTYSIVARDDATGQLGVAVQSCAFAVGAVVPWARAGVGAVATQAIAEIAHGPRCLDELANGLSAEQALHAALAVDPLATLRQVGVVGADGSSASSTGELCIEHAGAVTGDGFAVQANMMSSPTVWPAMASAFQNAAGSLARRLLAALEAGEDSGGDARGRMSAALVVVDAEVPTQAGTGTLIDIRIDRSDDPIGELSKLLVTAEGFDRFNAAVDDLFSGNAAGALGEIAAGLDLVPGDENMRFLRAGALIASGSVDAGTEELRRLIAGRPTWEIVVRSFASKGLISVPGDVSIESLLGTLDGP
jgi:uncharacterized Ntn-hydrolase superfamily protein